MNRHLRPTSDTDRSPVADFSRVYLNRWQAQGNLAAQVVGAMRASPELEPHRDHAGAAVANRPELRIVVPASSILSAPQLNKHKSATLEAAQIDDLDRGLLPAPQQAVIVFTFPRDMKNHAHPDAPPAVDLGEGAGRSSGAHQ